MRHTTKCPTRTQLSTRPNIDNHTINKGVRNQSRSFLLPLSCVTCQRTSVLLPPLSIKRRSYTVPYAQSPPHRQPIEYRTTVPGLVAPPKFKCFHRPIYSSVVQNLYSTHLCSGPYPFSRPRHTLCVVVRARSCDRIRIVCSIVT